MPGDAAVIANAVTIPVIVDADTGCGPTPMVMEAEREFERAGLAGMQIEDQESAKKCGHLPGAEQAGLSMDFLLKIRNKLVNAYNDVMRMPM